ncbi:hypothetical protein Pd630_LPD03606 [Rhodococcus opacus PD630]|nr:hypothetical protein Pd630_LPD03606 [Rhodococcus opacus PD630]
MHWHQSTDPSSHTAPPGSCVVSAEHTAPAMTVLSAETTTRGGRDSTHSSRTAGSQVAEGRPSTWSHQSASGLGSGQMIGSSGIDEDLLGSVPAGFRSGSAARGRCTAPHWPVLTVGDRSGRFACRRGSGAAGGDGMRTTGWISFSSTNVYSFAERIGHRTCGVGRSHRGGDPPASLSMPSQLYPTRLALSAKPPTPPRAGKSPFRAGDCHSASHRTASPHATGAPPRRINEIVRGKRSITVLPTGLLPVAAPRPAAWAALAFSQFGMRPCDSTLSRFIELGILDPADPLIACQWCDVIPRGQRRAVVGQRLS